MWKTRLDLGRGQVKDRTSPLCKHWRSLNLILEKVGGWGEGGKGKFKMMTEKEGRFEKDLGQLTLLMTPGTFH